MSEHSPTLVLAVECPWCLHLSRINWYSGIPVVPDRCAGCGQAWLRTDAARLQAQAPPAQAALEQALAGENPPAEAPEPAAAEGASGMPPP